MNLENWNANANANNNNKGQNQQFKIYRLKKKWKMNNTISFKHGMFGLVWFGPQKKRLMRWLLFGVNKSKKHCCLVISSYNIYQVIWKWCKWRMKHWINPSYMYGKFWVYKSCPNAVVELWDLAWCVLENVMWQGLFPPPKKKIYKQPCKKSSFRDAFSNRYYNLIPIKPRINRVNAFIYFW